MNMQQLIMQGQKMQRELKKAKEELAAKEFEVSKNGMITVVVLGNKQVKSINIDKDAFDADNKEMVEDTIAIAINEAIEKIEKAIGDINERITGSRIA